MPVSISIGLWTTLITYLISIPLGVAKAVRDGSQVRFRDDDVDHRRQCHTRLPVRHPAHRRFRRRPLSWTGFPCAASSLTTGMISPGRRASLDYFRHMALPLIAMSVGSFATLTLLDEEFLSRADQPAICADGASQGFDRAARALWPCLPQRHADRHRRISRRLHRHPVHRHLADRDHLLPRWPGLSRLRRADPPRLSGDVRRPLCLRAAWPGGEYPRAISPTRWSIRGSTSRPATNERGNVPLRGRDPASWAFASRP